MGHSSGSRDKILQCAKELFYRHGYQVTSVDDILKQCGVAKSNLYYHFKTKEELGLAVLELRISEQEAEALHLLRNPALTPTQRLNRFCEQLCHAQTEVARMSGCPFGNFAAALPNTEEDERSERFRLRLSELFRQMEAAMHDCLAEGVVCGEFRADIPASEMAAFLLAVVEGLLILTKTHKDTAPLVQGFALVQRLICISG
jgi:TetR/AcrR family transcriptional repressor of nem operon